MNKQIKDIQKVTLTKLLLPCSLSLGEGAGRGFFNMDYSKIPSPCYVLNEALLRKNLEKLNRIQKEAGIEIILAFKGFAMWSTFPLVREYLHGATASSLYEAKLCVEEMKCKAHLYAPVYFEEEFEELMDLSGHIVFNSLNQYTTFFPRIQKSGKHISCGLRINPGTSPVKTDLYNPASPHSRLGIAREEMPAELPAGIDGLHFHVLCENNSYQLESVLQKLEIDFADYLKQVKWLNMGGGHLMTREDYDTPHLIQVLKAFKAKHKVEIILEPGSAIAWQTGDLRAKVQDVVTAGGVKTAILDVSFTAHMPDTLEMPYRPTIAGAKDPDKNSKHLYRLGGVSCLAGDYHEAYDFGKELKPGDDIILKDMIHYTMVKTTTFNGVKHPSIGIWTEANEFKLVREFGYHDFKDRLS